MLVPYAATFSKLKVGALEDISISNGHRQRGGEGQSHPGTALSATGAVMTTSLPPSVRFLPVLLPS